MAIGFNTTSDYGSRQIIPDRGLNRSTKPRTHLTNFGDGYEQRLVSGINPLKEDFKVDFKNRARAEIDDIVGFFESKKGVTNFSFTFPDTNSVGNEETVKVVCEDWSISFENAEASSVSAKFRRVYDP